MSDRRRQNEPTRFGRELHALLALIGVKRSAVGDRGYTYSLHKQICRGERAPSVRALASLEKLLNHRLTTVLAAARRDPAKLDRLEQRFEGFTWLRHNRKTGHWTVNTAALGRLWQPRRPPGDEDGLPISIEGILAKPKSSDGPTGHHSRLRFKHQQLRLVPMEDGAAQLLIALSPAQAEQLRQALSDG